MDDLTSTIHRCKLNLKLDNNTEGYGNWFPNAVVQQCRRPEIRIWLKENKPWAIFNGSQSVRKKVTNFSLTSRHQTIARLKTKYDTELDQANNMSWAGYWNEMSKDGIWVEHMFVQVTAWFLGLDIKILTTSANQKTPFIVLYGDIDNVDKPSSGPPLLIGNYANVHYQSLLPKIIIQKCQQQRSVKILENTIEIKPMTNNEARPSDFIYIQNNEKILFSKSTIMIRRWS